MEGYQCSRPRGSRAISGRHCGVDRAQGWELSLQFLSPQHE